MVTKIEALQYSDFGSRVAEDDKKLASYFVETAVWKKLLSGEIDIVRGVKGSGKSALYKQLLNQKDNFSKKNILLISAENLSGEPIFKSVLNDTTLNESEFQNLWMIYIVTLIGNEIKISKNKSKEVREFINRLEAEKLLVEKGILRILTNVRDYVLGLSSKIQSIEGGMTVDPSTNTPSFNGKLSLNEPSSELRKQGIISLNELIEMANDALNSINKTVWITFDRLDVAFQDDSKIEALALKTLFRVYNNIKSHENIKLKIFIREDIWKRITDSGFREASHITRQITISWSDQDFLHLLVSRILDNEILCDYCNIKKDEALKDIDKQNHVFYSIFPKKVESGKNPETFKWMIIRVRDGLGITAPRELIHLMTESKDNQIKLLETGTREDSYETLISRSALKDALKQVSNTRLDQTIYAEYPHLKVYIEKLRDQKTEHDLNTLSKVFGTNSQTTAKVVKELIDIGFFEEKKGSLKPYWTPFLYRSGLSMIQGKEN